MIVSSPTGCVRLITDIPALRFLRQHFLPILFISLLLAVPCFWHRHIEAGDLPSHVYNAWLAQLIAKGQAPGLYLAHRYSNVLFDLALLHAAEVIGLVAAEKIVVALSVLVFFWGAFSFVTAVSECPPWFLAPCIAMLAYGYSFEMGFLNYYLSLGLACIALALAWRGGAGNWLLVLVIAPLVLLAHPMGFLWLLATLAYHRIRQRLPGWWKLILPVSVAAVFLALHWYFAHRATFPVDWEAPPVYLLSGADQIILYGERYSTLAWVALAFGVLCVVVEFLPPTQARPDRKKFILPLEFYAVTFIGTAMLPENFRLSLTTGWIGLVVSRLTAITALFGLCFLASLKPRKWHLAGFSTVTLLFFSFLYQDTGWINRLESGAESAVSTLSYGTRIIPTIPAPPAWRITFIGHVADRACIGRCFTYSNYEAPSQQFRVRVGPQGSPLVTSAEDDAEDMEGGSYEIQDTDPPLMQLYQCDSGNPTKLCLRALREGDVTTFSPPPPVPPTH